MPSLLSRPPADLQAVPLAVLEGLSDGLSDIVFFVKDIAGRYLAVNRTLVERCGLLHRSELLGRTADEVFPGPLGQGYTSQDRQVIATGRAIEGRLELHLYAAGRRGWCRTWKRPILDSAGGVAGLIGLSRDLHREDERHPEYGRLAAALEILHRDYAEPIRLTHLARSAGLSMDRFERLVRDVFALTPRQLLAKIRIDAASHQLLTTGASVADIALLAGYTDHSAFARQFKALVGITPSEFRAHQGPARRAR